MYFGFKLYNSDDKIERKTTINFEERDRQEIKQILMDFQEIVERMSLQQSKSITTQTFHTKYQLKDILKFNLFLKDIVYSQGTFELDN